MNSEFVQQDVEFKKFIKFLEDNPKCLEQGGLEGGQGLLPAMLLYFASLTQGANQSTQNFLQNTLPQNLPLLNSTLPFTNLNNYIPSLGESELTQVQPVQTPTPPTPEVQPAQTLIPQIQTLQSPTQEALEIEKGETLGLSQPTITKNTNTLQYSPFQFFAPKQKEENPQIETTTVQAKETEQIEKSPIEKTVEQTTQTTTQIQNVQQPSKELVIPSFNNILSNKLREEKTRTSGFLSVEEILEFEKNPLQIINNIFKDTSYKGFQNTKDIVYPTLKLIFENGNNPQKALLNIAQSNLDTLFVGKNPLTFGSSLGEKRTLSIDQKKNIEYLLRLMSTQEFQWREFFSVFSLAEDICGKIYLTPLFNNQIYSGPSLGSFIVPGMEIDKNFQNTLCNTALFQTLESAISFQQDYQFDALDYIAAENGFDLFFGSAIQRFSDKTFDENKLKWKDFINELEKVIVIETIETLTPQENFEKTQEINNYLNQKPIFMSDVPGMLGIELWPGQSLGDLLHIESVDSNTFLQNQLENANPMNKQIQEKKQKLPMTETQKLMKDSLLALWDTYILKNRKTIEKFIQDGYPITSETVKKIFQDASNKIGLNGPLGTYFASSEFLISSPQNYIDFMDTSINTAMQQVFPKDEKEKINKASFAILYKFYQACPKEFTKDQCREQTKVRFQEAVDEQGRFNGRKANFNLPKERTWTVYFYEQYEKLKKYGQYAYYALTIFIVLKGMKLLKESGTLEIAENVLGYTVPKLGQIVKNELEKTFNVSSWMSNYLFTSLVYTPETILIVDTRKLVSQRKRAKVCYNWSLKTLESRLQNFLSEKLMDETEKKEINKKTLHYFIVQEQNENIIKVNVNDYTKILKTFLLDFLNQKKNVCFLLK